MSPAPPAAPLDTVIVGAGPSGLACALEAARAGLRYVVVEKGGITDAIRRFPTDMTFFSTPELLEIGGIPFTTPNLRPTRVEVLQYYRKVVEAQHLALRLYTRVTSIASLAGGGFTVGLGNGEILTSRTVIVATGYFDHVNRLNIPGEDLPHVSHYYREPYGYAHTNVAVIGGRNSATEAALDLYRHGARVTLIHRGSEVHGGVKYWLKPDLENRLKAGSIAAHFNTVVTRISSGELDVQHTPTGATQTLRADFVLALIGHRPDEALLRSAGVTLSADLVPVFDPATYETNIPDLFVAGSVQCGCATWTLFIENSRAHAAPIIARVAATVV